MPPCLSVLAPGHFWQYPPYSHWTNTPCRGTGSRRGRRFSSTWRRAGKELSMHGLKPREVAQLLPRGFGGSGSVIYLQSLVGTGRIPPPPRDASGHYWFARTDLDNVRRAIRQG